MVRSTPDGLITAVASDGTGPTGATTAGPETEADRGGAAGCAKRAAGPVADSTATASTGSEVDSVTG
jgi:hypothetical protein